jgi:uncharacterized membrane protein (UPF0127 family)
MKMAIGKWGKAIAIVLVVVTALALLLTMQTGHVPSSFTINGRETFNFTYVATTEQQRGAGLMNKTVDNSTFMLFVFPSKSINPFWMYNTYFNLDILWLNSSLIEQNGISTKVVYLQENATPCFDATSCAVYIPSNVSDYVIEAEAGFAKAHNISIGTEMILNYK